MVFNVVDMTFTIQCFYIGLIVIYSVKPDYYLMPSNIFKNDAIDTDMNFLYVFSGQYLHHLQILTQ